MTMRPIILLLLLTVSACAGSGPRRGAPPGSLEGLGTLEERFTAADSDGDEQLSVAELEAGWPELVPQFDALDTDLSGRVSVAELSSYLEWRRIVRASQRDRRAN